MVAENTPLQHNDYVAVLKCKQGEMQAIRETSPTHFVPLVEVIDTSKWNQLARAWSHQNGVVWVHPLARGERAPIEWASDVEALFGNLRARAVSAVPVVTVEENIETYSAIHSVVAQDRRGIVLRLDCEEILEEDSFALTSRIGEVLSLCGQSVQDCDLVVDAGLVEGGVAVCSTAVYTALSAVPEIGDWRSVVVAFSGFPAVVGDIIHTSTVGLIPRTDAAAFGHLRARWMARELAFADYGVGVPQYSDVSWSPVPNIRYTLDTEWAIHRAATRRDPSPQYVQLATDVVAATYYRGASFSSGDRYLSDVASRAAGPGNAASYLRMAMSHHFAVVLDSLATRGAP
ncbi:hypothetical protein GGQ54_001801 [Naumannella cuiyingiana]|uniref:T4 beta protein n=1 Tax=Naumannella cuiyingiana TaxID=1347891 RepID=A0A7Z0IL63_9ACTN|nr:beta family protein [Naumannella cuiyingiana]NYI71241.1 hypothetical protein [Naumannella cuiyingiana]